MSNSNDDDIVSLSLGSVEEDEDCFEDSFEYFDDGMFEECYQDPGIDDSTILFHDLKLTFFCAALHSVKSTQLVKPYPMDFFNKDMMEPNFDLLKKTFAEINPYCNSGQIKSNQSNKLENWIVNTGSFRLEPIKFNQMDPKALEVLRKDFITLPGEGPKLKSVYVPNFLMQYFSDNNHRTDKFNEYKQLFGTIYAFHGSSVANFHSILHNGLASSMNVRSAYGVGTYFSTTLAVSLQYAPYEYNQFANKSLFGSRLSCVALCEIINHPGLVLGKMTQNNIPQEYYVVPNDEWIRIAYVLVYTYNEKGIIDQCFSSPEIENHEMENRIIQKFSLRPSKADERPGRLRGWESLVLRLIENKLFCYSLYASFVISVFVFIPKFGYQFLSYCQTFL